MSMEQQLFCVLKELRGGPDWLNAISDEEHIYRPALQNMSTTIISNMNALNDTGIISYEEYTSPAPRAETATGVSILEAPLPSSNLEEPSTM